MRLKLKDIATSSVPDPHETPTRETRPYFADVERVTFAVIKGKSELVDSPWNSIVSLFGTGEEDLMLDGFEHEESTNDDGITSHVAKFMYRLKNKQPVKGYWNDSSNYSKLSRELLTTVASEYWDRVLSFDPLVSSSQLNVIKEKQENKSDYNKRLKRLMTSPVQRNHSILARLLKDSLVHKHKSEEANALVYLLRNLVRKLDSTEVLQADLKSIEKLTPTHQMLGRLGRIPDINITAFKTMFHTSEWEAISGSNLYKGETELKKILSEKIIFDCLPNWIKRVDDLRESVKADALSKAVLESKRERLKISSVWKKQSDGRVAIEPIKELAKHRNDEKMVKAFSPFDLLVLANHSGSETGFTRVRYNLEKRVFAWAKQDPDDDEVASDLVESAGREYVAALNKL